MFFDPLLQGAAQSGGGLATRFKSKSSLTGGLVNFASVVLAAPLYEGPGGVLNPSFWRGPTPEAGTTLYYDSAHMTVQPNGEIVTTSQNFSAVLQFAYQGTMQQGLLIVTSGLATIVDAVAKLRGPLTTRIALATGFRTKKMLRGAPTTSIAMRDTFRSKVSLRGVPATSVALVGGLRATSTLHLLNVIPPAMLVTKMRSRVSLRPNTTTRVALQSQMAAHALLRATPATQVALDSRFLSRVSMVGGLLGGTTVVYAAPTQLSLVDEVFVVDGSDCYLSLAFVDMNNKAYTPRSLSYEISDETNGATVLPLTPIVPITSSMLITITGAQNTMNSASKFIERRRVLFKIGIPGGTYRYDSLPYAILRETGTP